MDLEYHTLEKMGCWRVVKISILPPSVKLISCKWVLKLKYTNGVYEKHKARIVGLLSKLLSYCLSGKLASRLGSYSEP